MRIKSVVATICAAAIAVSSASASETQSNSVSAKERQAEQQPKKICKWLPVTGSNKQERHCLTKEDWKKAEAMSW